MPELPEVETIRRGLQAKIKGRKIARVAVRNQKIVRGSAAALRRALAGARFGPISRRGKLLIFTLQKQGTQHSPLFLLLHLKMTGQLIYRDQKKMLVGGHGWPPVTASLPNKYSHLIIEFANRSNLFFNDMRQFGFVQLVTKEQLGAVLAGYGLEPLTASFTTDTLRRALRWRSTSIKACLLNQSIVAGVGNIYADEICFAARLRPQRRASSLTRREVAAIATVTPKILRRAITYGGTTWRNYRDADGGVGSFVRLLKVYGRSGKMCVRCGTVLQRARVAGRGTVYCPLCQR